MMNFVGSIGKGVSSFFSFYTGLISLLYYSVGTLFSSRVKGKKIAYLIALQQVYFTGVQALSIIGLVGFALGAILIVSVLVVVNVKQATDMLGFILVLALVEILGPLLTAIIVIARSGTAMATEIANMVVRNEMLALESMAVNTLNYIVLPRLIGMVISIACLMVFFDVVAVLGGAGVALLIKPDLEVGRLVFDQFFMNMDFSKLAAIFVKAVFFGCGISLICIINGFKVLTYPGGVPVSGIRGVVSSLFYVFVVGAVLTVLFLI